jgi:hypothetical protein
MEQVKETSDIYFPHTYIPLVLIVLSIFFEMCGTAPTLSKEINFLVAELRSRLMTKK